MPTPRTVILAVAAALGATACSPRLLPGTQIEDRGENRAIYLVLGQYKAAMEKKDAAGVLALVAPDYYDNAGTPNPDDDKDAAGLAQTLPVDLAKLETVKVELTLRRITVKDGEAEVEVFYDAWYRVKTPTSVVPRRDSDVHRMKLKKLDGSWRFTSGL